MTASSMSGCPRLIGIDHRDRMLASDAGDRTPKTKRGETEPHRRPFSTLGALYPESDPSHRNNHGKPGPCRLHRRHHCRTTRPPRQPAHTQLATTWGVARSHRYGVDDRRLKPGPVHASRIVGIFFADGDGSGNRARLEAPFGTRRRACAKMAALVFALGLRLVDRGLYHRRGACHAP